MTVTASDRDGRARLAPWLRELATTLPGLIRSYVPGAGLDARSRERIIMAVTEVTGCRYTVWIDGGWQSFLGGADDVDEVLVDFAKASAEAGRPLDPTPLAQVVGAGGLGPVQAAVAHGVVSNLVGTTFDGLLGRLVGQRRFDLPAAVGEAFTVAAAAPVALPLFGVAAALRVTERVVPPPKAIELPPDDEANLLVHMLAQALSAWLGNAAIRLVLLALPVSATIGVRAGQSGATVRVGRGEVSIANGVATDAWVVVEGDIEPLLHAATGSIVRELRSVRLRPNQ